MQKIWLGIGLGLAAAIVDVIPMLIQRLPFAACASAAAQWLVMGLVITTCELGLPGWATGLALAPLSALPIVIAAVGNPSLVKPGEEAKTVTIMLVTSAVLGTAIGVVSRLAKP